MFSSHNGIKLEINDRNITGRSPNTWIHNIFNPGKKKFLRGFKTVLTK